jgi:hypothetical protein
MREPGGLIPCAVSEIDEVCVGCAAKVLRTTASTSDEHRNRTWNDPPGITSSKQQN